MTSHCTMGHMFRVPNNPANPTFDDTFKVSFTRWLTSKRPERLEWARRRNAAAKLAGQNQVARAVEREQQSNQ